MKEHSIRMEHEARRYGKPASSDIHDFQHVVVNMDEETILVCPLLVIILGCFFKPALSGYHCCNLLPKQLLYIYIL